MHTFVIPVYKESPYLEQCIQSLIRQAVKSQILITTSTPTDYTLQIANKYGLDYHVSDEKGIANDWNFALSKVTTPLATIAHQDDIYEPDYTANIISTITKNKTNNVLIAFTGYNDIVNNSTRAWSLNSFVKKALLFPFAFSDTISNSSFKKMLLLFGDPICCPSVTYNLAALTGFKFSTSFTCTLDWYAWYLLAKQPGAFCFINKKLIRHRIHPESETTFQLSQGIRKQEELQMFKMMWGNKAAAFIAWIYTLGHANNKLKAD
jgi:glycosyltransferase involved in cell wall biosynthesis